MSILQNFSKLFLKIVSVMIAFVLTCPLLTSCILYYDDYEIPIIGDFYVSRANLRDCWLIHWEDISNSIDRDTIIDTYVREYCNNDRYIGIKQVTLPDDILDLTSDEYETTLKELTPVYYLVDSQTRDVYGPYENATEYSNKLQELEISDMSEWKYTYPRPKNALPY